MKILFKDNLRKIMDAKINGLTVSKLYVFLFACFFQNEKKSWLASFHIGILFFTVSGQMRNEMQSFTKDSVISETILTLFLFKL